MNYGQICLCGLVTLVLLAGSGSGHAAEIGWVQLGSERFTVELARTPEMQAQGLMYRAELASGRGMLFIYPNARPVAFWMKNTLLHLDILFFDAALHLVTGYQNVPPCETELCPQYPSTQPARYVLELPAGTARRLDIQPGAQLTVGQN